MFTSLEIAHIREAVCLSMFLDLLLLWLSAHLLEAAVGGGGSSLSYYCKSDHRLDELPIFGWKKWHQSYGYSCNRSCHWNIAYMTGNPWQCKQKGGDSSDITTQIFGQLCHYNPRPFPLVTALKAVIEWAVLSGSIVCARSVFSNQWVVDIVIDDRFTARAIFGGFFFLKDSTFGCLYFKVTFFCVIEQYSYSFMWRGSIWALIFKGGFQILISHLPTDPYNHQPGLWRKGPCPHQHGYMAWYGSGVGHPPYTIYSIFKTD